MPDPQPSFTRTFGTVSFPVLGRTLAELDSAAVEDLADLVGDEGCEYALEGITRQQDGVTWEATVVATLVGTGVVRTPGATLPLPGSRGTLAPATPPSVDARIDRQVDR